MRGQAKAAATRSRTLEASRLGQIMPGALASRDSSHDSKGSGASEGRLGRRSTPALLLSGLALSVILAVAPVAVADVQPTVATNPAEDVGVTTARLSGTVNPEGASGEPSNTSWRIEYSLEGSGAWSVANQGTIEPPASEEGNPTPVEAIFGFGGELQPGQSYEFRLVAENGAGSDETPSPYPSFEMQEATAPALVTESPDGIGYTSATLHGTVDPEGGNVNPIGPEVLPIFWQFEINREGTGWSGVGSSSEISGAAAEGSSPIPVEATLAPGALQAGKAYEVRLHAYYLNFSRQAVSPEPFESFETTAVLPPAVSIDPASSVTDVSAAFSGTVEAGGSDPAFTSICRFEILNDAAFQATVDEQRQLTVGAASGTYTLSFAGSSSESPLTTGPIAFDAPATGGGSVQAALEALANLGPGAVSVSGGPGDEGGNFPYIVTFSGQWSGQSVSLFQTDGSSLNGSAAIYNFRWSHLPGTFSGAPAFACNPNPVEGGTPVTVQADSSQLPLDDPLLFKNGRPEIVQPNTTYHLRLRAWNQGGESTADTTFTSLHIKPAAITRPAHNVEPGEATLQGIVNPHNDQTSYWFEYGTEDCNTGSCQSIPATQDAEAGSGNVRVHVARTVADLEPEATYHFRLVAMNGAGTTDGADRTFTTPPIVACPNEARRAEEHATFLPECRAYEMVSPPDKLGSDIFQDSTRTRVSAGETPSLPAAAVFTSQGSFAGPQGTGFSSEFLSARDGVAGTRGWSTHGITPFQVPSSFAQTGLGLEMLYDGELSADLTKGLVRSWTPQTDAPNVQSQFNLYLRDDLRSPGPGSYRLLSDSPTFLPAPPLKVGGYPYPRVVGASSDFQHALFEIESNLSPGAAGKNMKLYKWDGGLPRLISDGTGTCPGAEVPEAPCSAAGLSAIGVSIGDYKPTSDAISEDGSRVNFKSPVGFDAIPFSLPSTKLYQFDDLGTPSAADDVVIQLDRSENSTPESHLPANYVGASADGSRVFMVSGEQLTEAPGGGLYLWERQNENQVQSLNVDASGGTFTLTASAGALEATTPALPHDATAAAVQAALEALEGPSPFGQRLIGEGNVAVGGGPGAYEIAFRGALAGVDVPKLAADSSGLTGGTASATVTVSQPVHNLTLIGPSTDVEAVTFLGASKDGHRAYFTARGELVPGAALHAKEPPEAIYLWQDIGPNPELSFVGEYKRVGGGRPSEDIMSPPEVTPDGKRLLFALPYGRFLAPEYEPPECATGKAGCLAFYLYSADTSTPQDPDLVCVTCNYDDLEQPTRASTGSGAGYGLTRPGRHFNRAIAADGSRVFFNTNASLVPDDTNGKLDVYEFDARTGKQHLISSGTDSANSYYLEMSADGHDAYFATRARLLGWDKDSNYDMYDARVGGGFPEPPAPPTAPCEGETCRRPTGPPPPTTPVGSAGEGPGNPKPTKRCPRGKRPVARYGKGHCAKKRHHHKRSHKQSANHNRRAGK